MGEDADGGEVGEDGEAEELWSGGHGFAWGPCEVLDGGVVH